MEPVKYFYRIFITATFIASTSFAQGEGVSREEFEKVQKTIYQIYAGDFEKKGLSLSIADHWDSNENNLRVSVKDLNRTIHFYGGAARNPLMTQDALLLVACHEMGHIIGFAPELISEYAGGVVSIEGASDYFSTLKCSRRVWKNDNNEAIISTRIIPDHLKELCKTQFKDPSDTALCLRSVIASIDYATWLTTSTRGSSVDVNTVDHSIVSKLMNTHPAPQCRLDTLIAGALCNRSYLEDISPVDPNQGACSILNGDHIGNRPKCWYVDINPGLPQIVTCKIQQLGPVAKNLMSIYGSATNPLQWDIQREQEINRYVGSIAPTNSFYLNAKTRIGAKEIHLDLALKFHDQTRQTQAVVVNGEMDQDHREFFTTVLVQDSIPISIRCELKPN